MKNNILSVISGTETWIGIDGYKKQKKVKDIIGIVCVNDDIEYINAVSICYPYRDGEIRGMLDSIRNTGRKLVVRPATDDEIHTWMHANGEDKHIREKISDLYEIKEMTVISELLKSGIKIITELTPAAMINNDNEYMKIRKKVNRLNKEIDRYIINKILSKYSDETVGFSGYNFKINDIVRIEKISDNTYEASVYGDSFNTLVLNTKCAGPYEKAHMNISKTVYFTVGDNASITINEKKP